MRWQTATISSFLLEEIARVYMCARVCVRLENIPTTGDNLLLVL